MAPARLSEEPLLVREEGSATRQVTERTLERAGVRWRVGMELHHTEAIKQAVMAGLGVAFVSMDAGCGGSLHGCGPRWPQRKTALTNGGGACTRCGECGECGASG